MQVATASVSIAPFPVLMPLDDEVKAELVAAAEQAVVKVELPSSEKHVTFQEEWKDFQVADEHLSPAKTLRRQKAFFMSPPATPTKKKYIDLPPCCLSLPTTGKTMPAEHVIAAFFAGALIGSALVMCFSDHSVAE
jgi:hypothetical protein